MIPAPLTNVGVAFHSFSEAFRQKFGHVAPDCISTDPKALTLEYFDYRHHLTFKCCNFVWRLFYTGPDYKTFASLSAEQYFSFLQGLGGALSKGDSPQQKEAHVQAKSQSVDQARPEKADSENKLRNFVKDVFDEEMKSQSLSEKNVAFQDQKEAKETGLTQSPGSNLQASEAKDLTPKSSTISSHGNEAEIGVLIDSKIRQFGEIFDHKDWAVEDEGPGFKIWKRAHPLNVERKAEVTIPMSLDQFVARILDFRSMQLVNPDIIVHKEIEKYSDNYSLVFVEYKVSFPFSNREFLSFQVKRRTESDFTMVNFAANDNLKKGSGSNVRGKNVLSGWAAEKVTEDSIKVRFLTITNPNISVLPKALIEMGSKEAGKIPLLFSRKFAKATK